MTIERLTRTRLLVWGQAFIGRIILQAQASFSILKKFVPIGSQKRLLKIMRWILIALSGIIQKPNDSSSRLGANCIDRPFNILSRRDTRRGWKKRMARYLYGSEIIFHCEQKNYICQIIISWHNRLTGSVVFLAAVGLLLGSLSLLRLVQLLMVEHPLLLESDAQLQAGVLFRTAGVDILGSLNPSWRNFNLRKVLMWHQGFRQLQLVQEWCQDKGKLGKIVVK